MSCAQQRSNRSCHRCRWASACGHSVAWGWDAAAWEWDAAWEAAARRACRTGAGCTDVVDRKKNPAKVGPWRGLRRAAQRGGLSRASSGMCHANPQKRLCPVTGKATRRRFRSGVAFSAQFARGSGATLPQRKSRTKANWAESPSSASAMRITSSRRNRPSRLLPGSSGKYSWVVSTGCCGAWTLT